MNNLPEDIQHIIYKYKHNLDYFAVLEELCSDVFYYCEDCGQAIGFYRRCECDGGEFSVSENGIDTDSDTDSESTNDSMYERYLELEHALGPDGDFWYQYM